MGMMDGKGREGKGEVKGKERGDGRRDLVHWDAQTFWRGAPYDIQVCR